ncbi:MAG TPA: hypothetical protein DDZ53_08650, partial [Firmicutes bacterium]|nr:hypothetical protein [Bacillota bacterium]
MHPILSIKMLFRSPAKMLVTFLLLTAISFALFARILDYTATELLRYAGLTSLTFTDIVPLTVDPLPAGSKNSFPLTFYMVKKEGLAERSPNGLLDFNTNTFYTWNQKIHGGKIYPDRFGEFYGGKLDKRNTYSTTFPLGFDIVGNIISGERYLIVVGHLYIIVPKVPDLA